MNRTCPIGSFVDRYPMKSDTLLLLFLALILLFVYFFCLSGHCVQFGIVAIFFLFLFNNKDTKMFNHERMLSLALRIQPVLSAWKFYSITGAEHEQSSPTPGSSPSKHHRDSTNQSWSNDNNHLQGTAQVFSYAWAKEKASIHGIDINRPTTSMIVSAILCRHLSFSG